VTGAVALYGYTGSWSSKRWSTQAIGSDTEDLEERDRAKSATFWRYPLVNVYVTMERSTMLLMGKSTISMVIFNSYVSHYQRVYNFEVILRWSGSKQAAFDGICSEFTSKLWQNRNSSRSSRTCLLFSSVFQVVSNAIRLCSVAAGRDSVEVRNPAGEQQNCSPCHPLWITSTQLPDTSEYACAILCLQRLQRLALSGSA